MNKNKVCRMAQNNSELPESLSIMGMSVTPFDSYSHAVRCISSRIERRQRTFCVAVNPEKAYHSFYDPALKVLLNSADIQLCDGIGIVYAARILLGKKLVRTTGAQLFFNLIRKASEDGLKVFLLGASPQSNELACSNLLKTYPRLKIAGHQDGFFEDDNAVIKEINESNADMLFVAMGSPRQEFWIAEHKDAITSPFCMAVGGTLDVISGHAKWPPKIFRKTGTEFLYRLIMEPRRWRRQLVLPKFALMILKERLFSSRINS